MEKDVRRIKCNRMEVVSCTLSGFLRCIAPYTFFVVSEDDEVQAEIREECDRRIILSSSEELEVNRLYSIFLNIESLLHIFDGSFLVLKDIIISGNENEDTYNEFRNQFFAQRMRYHTPSNLFRQYVMTSIL